MDIDWIIYGILLIGGGYILIAGIIRMTNDDLDKKCGTLGYQLYKLTLSWRAAYWKCFFTIIKTPLVLTGFGLALAGYSGGHIWETLIVGVIVTIPPSISQIQPFLRREEKEAEKSYRED